MSDEKSKPGPLVESKDQRDSTTSYEGFFPKWAPTIIALLAMAGIWIGPIWERDDKLLESHLQMVETRLKSLDNNVDARLAVLDTKLESLDDKLSQVQGSFETRLIHLERLSMAIADRE